MVGKATTAVIRIERHCMKRCVLSATILFTLLFLPAFAQWELVWSDEFEYAGLPDTAKWGYDVGGGGWGNQELQYYTREDTANASVHDGMLTITARSRRRSSRITTPPLAL
jgi:hypothetical protein